MIPERWQQIDQLFHGALAQKPAERDAFLIKACAGDESLRLEIESLLMSHDAAQSFIEATAGSVAAEMLGTNKPRFESGHQIENYKIVRQLGSGGMGEVYLADDTRLNRKIALKLLPSSYTNDADRVRRFEHEAQAASALNHPNIVTIYEIGQADSLHFIATEFVDGKTLREQMSDTQMTVGEVLDVASQVASALEAAHEAGIVHRDIKPENIMLRRDAFAKVLDFGLAKLAEKRSGDEEAERPEPGLETPAPASPRPPVPLSSKTDPGTVMGTAGYMSPEQARGAEVDARTDIWSLGVVLYEMVAGRAPFVGETTSQVIVSILESEPPQLSLGDDVPKELEWIISKALHKERAERYQTAGELARDLKSLKEELTIESRLKQFRRSDADGRETATMRERRVALNTVHGSAMSTADLAIGPRKTTAGYLIASVKHHRASAVFASVTVFFLIALVLYFSNVSNRGGEAIASVAVLPFVNESGDPNTEYLSHGISDSIINTLSRLPNLKVISFNAALRYKGQPVDPKAIGRELNVEAVLVGRMAQRGDQLTISAELVDVRDHRRLWGDQYNTKLSGILVFQREIAQQISNGLRLRLSGNEKNQINKQYTRNPDAHLAYLWGRSLLQKRTRQTTEKSIEYFEEAIRLDPNFALAYATLADAQVSLGKFLALSPAESLTKARQTVAKALEIDDTLAEAHAALGSIRLLEWDWSGAERAFNRAKELNPSYDRNHHDYESYLLAMKRFDEAVAESRRVLELEPVSAVHHINMGGVLNFARRYDEAIEQCQKAIELEPNMPTAYRCLAHSYEHKKLYDQAVEAYLKTAEFGPEVEVKFREAYATSGWKEFWRKALDLKEERAKHQRISLEALARNYARLNEKDKALETLEKVYEQRHFTITLLNRDPFWDVYSSDPRYINIIRRMGLEP